MIEIQPCPVGEPPARDLVAAMVAEIVSLYGAVDGGGLRGGVVPTGLEPPEGLYLVGWSPGGEAVAGGGLRRIEDGVAEVKRMYVVPSWRGRGVSRLLLGALEDAARALGYRRVRLDTGPSQPAARHLYEVSGYRSIPDYNANPHATYWGEKKLS